MISPEAIRLYRQFLWNNADVPRPLPPGLIAMHERAWSLLHPYGGRSALSAETLVHCVLLWQQTTADGQRFMAGNVEDDPTFPFPTLPMSVKKLQTQLDNTTDAINWKKVRKGTRVVVQRKGETLHGVFGRVMNKQSIAVRLDGHIRAVACSSKTSVLEEAADKILAPTQAVIQAVG